MVIVTKVTCTIRGWMEAEMITNMNSPAVRRFMYVTREDDVVASKERVIRAGGWSKIFNIGGRYETIPIHQPDMYVTINYIVRELFKGQGRRTAMIFVTNAIFARELSSHLVLVFGDMDDIDITVIYGTDQAKTERVSCDENQLTDKNNSNTSEQVGFFEMLERDAHETV